MLPWRQSALVIEDLVWLCKHNALIFMYLNRETAFQRVVTLVIAGSRYLIAAQPSTS